VEPASGCQPCTACCTCMSIRELGKPKFVPCKHLNQVGCSIYADRPGTCRSWACLWRLGVVKGGEEFRPDQLGLMFENTHQSRATIFERQCFLAYETRADARLEPKAKKVLETIARDYPIAVWRPDGFWLGGPPVLVERAAFNLRKQGYTKSGDLFLAPPGTTSTPYL